MDAKAIIDQTRVETETLEHIKDALLATLAWQVDSKTFARKLSSVRFVAGWFRDHLERLFSLEEHDGYMMAVKEVCPHMTDKTDALRREHDDLRGELHRIMPCLDRVSPIDHEQFELISVQLLRLIKRLDRHTEKENNLLQEALLRDEGVGD